jgi:hypothetical protein
MLTVTQIKLRRIFIRRAQAVLAIAAQEPQRPENGARTFYNVAPAQSRRRRKSRPLIE